MPHSYVALVDGVNENRTPTLNEFGLSFSQLVRYQYDNQGNILVQKLGGWTRYYQSPMAATVRGIWGWQNTQAQKFLAVGTENVGGTFQATLSQISNGSLHDITPRQIVDNITPVVNSTAGSSYIKITDTTVQNISSFDTVYFPTHISIGGIVLFGLYACNPDGFSSPTQYTVQSVDVLGNPLPATGTSSSPALAEIATGSGVSLVQVTLNNHGYNTGDTFPILIPTTVGGSTFYGQYPVQSVIDANNFVIVATETPTSSTSGFINNGYAQFIYCHQVGSSPTGLGYGLSTYGAGGYGTSVSGTGVPGVPVAADDWQFDNWGEILIAEPDPSAPTFATTGTSGTGSTGTVTFSGQYVAPVNATVTIANVTPPTWNGTYLSTASSAGSVSFATSNTSAMTGAGTITIANAPFSPIYFWNSEAGALPAAVIPQAPPVNGGFFIAMPQRQIIAWGSTFTGIQDPLLVRWCDVNNYNQWIALVTNQAGSFRLTKGSRIVGGLQAPQQGLLWTDIDLWSMQYIGGQGGEGQLLVYSFNEIGTGCGLIAKKAAASVNGVIYWMSPSQFFTMTENGVQPLPCPIWDVMFQQLDQSNVDKIRIAVNSRFNEVEWFYPTLTSNGEVAAYVKYNYAIGLWDYGSLARTAWIDQSVLGPPIGADPTSLYLYQHETSTDADNQPLMASIQTGYFAIAEGDELAFVDQIWPDAKFGYFNGSQGATLNLTLLGANYPEDTPETSGPFTVTASTQFVSPRIRKRLLAFQLSSDDIGSFWRIGRFRYRFQPDGKF